MRSPLRVVLSALVLAAGLMFVGLRLVRAPDPVFFTGPWDLTALARPPAVTEGESSGAVTALTYQGVPYRGKPTRVFAYLARPARAEGKLPAVVLVHGGGGKAFKEWAELWANRGYIALAMDLAGRGPDGRRLSDGGPDMTDPTILGQQELTDFWPYHAVAAVVRGVSLLTARRDVDPDRIGITGISWGGYVTCIVAGLDRRLKVAVPVYGCGFLHENSYWLQTFRDMPPGRRALWVENFEPSRYLAQAAVPMLFVNGTNDFAFPLDSYRKSYRLVKDRTVCVTVGMRHGHAEGWAPVEIGLFVDQHLKRGAPLPRIGPVKRDAVSVAAPFRAVEPVTAAGLSYTTDTGDWQLRTWHTVRAEVTDGAIRAELPDTRPIVYFFTLTDRRNATVSTEHEERP